MNLRVLTKERPSIDYTDETMNLMLHDLLEDIISVWRKDTVGG
jgi:hypothetical protein